MGAVGMLARDELRRRWRGTVVATLIVGIVGALVCAALAGARRSDRALADFSRETRSADVSLLPAFLYRPKRAETDGLRRLPQVESIAVLQTYAITVMGAPPTLGPLASVDDAVGNVIDRDVLLAGRRPDPGAVDEVVLGETLAKQIHQGVGGHIEATSYSQKELLHYALLPGPYPLGNGPRLRFRIVGVVRQRLDLGDFAASGGVLVMTPAFDRKYEHTIGSYGAIIRVRTKRGAADVPSVLAAAERIFAKSGSLSAQSVAVETEGAGSAIDVVSTALQLLAAVAALAGVVTITIILSREAGLAGIDNTTRRMLGMTTKQRTLVGWLRTFVISVGGALLAIAGAVALSPRFPVGLARRADLDVGVHADWTVLAPGGLAIAVIVALVGSIAAFRVARRIHPDGVARDPAARVLAKAGGRWPTMANGLRMALDPGHGSTAVPVRSASVGAVFGVVGIVAVLLFGASLNHLADTPRLYGWTWDFSVPDNNFSPVASKCDRADFGISRMGGVAALAAVCDNDTQLDGRPVTAWGVLAIRGGDLEPAIVNGRAPAAASEVALAAKTLEALHKHVGDSVRGPKPKHATYRIVGTVVLPTLAYPQPLADGALFTNSGFLQAYDANSRASRNLIGRFTPSADRAVLLRAMSARQREGPARTAATPIEIEHLRDVTWIPRVLAALLAGLALVAVGHALVTATRNRRRDFATLKTLGFTRSQVSATVAWQATAFGAVGLLFGVPLGVLVGRLAWQIVADSLGVSPAFAISVVSLVVVPAALVVANLVAIVPARTAARIRPARALRAE